MQQQLFKRLEELYPQLVEWRRDMHMYPELSFEEEHTPQKIATILKSLGLEVKTEVGGRGVTAWLRGGKPGPSVALRADFDALPIQDEKNVPYRSKIPNKMHACGHDIHTAGLLGVAQALSECREQLAGNVLFIHQFAEEITPGGAKPMIEDGCLDGVDVIYGAHVWSVLPYGTVAFKEGHVMAASDMFEVEIIGKGGHGAFPHVCIDPIVIGSQIINQLQHIVSRKVNPLQSAVVTVGSFQSGEAFNVIPSTASLKGTVRAFDEDVRQMMKEAVESIVTSTSTAMGAEHRFNYVSGYPAVYNHAEETQRIAKVAANIVGSSQVSELDPVMGGEDFAYYLQERPGSFFFVGGGNPDIGATYPHHHPRFDVDERSMLIIGKVMISAVLDYFANHK